MKKYTPISELNNINSPIELYTTITREYNPNDKNHDRVFYVIKKLNLDKFPDSWKSVFLLSISSFYLCTNAYNNPEYYKFLFKQFSFNELISIISSTSEKDARRNMLKYGIGILKSKISNNSERDDVEKLYKEKNKLFP